MQDKAEFNQGRGKKLRSSESFPSRFDHTLGFEVIGDDSEVL